jgi:hypothetical protein
MAVKAKKKEAPIVGVHRIDVDTAGNARVTTTPADRVFIKDKDTVEFTSSTANSVILYRRSSPFAEIPVGVPFPIGRSIGPFKCIRKGNHHFDCGQIVDGAFSAWAETDGGDTPVDDGGGQ